MPDSPAPLAIFITTRNEEKNLPFALESARGWAKEIFVLDSGSTDRTKEMAEQCGATFLVRDWEGYARTKNWGLDNLPFTAPWVFILDADEVITPALRDELIDVASHDGRGFDAYQVNRYFVFLGRRIRHCGFYPSWNVRFLKRGKARYEQREVHEHMIVEGRTGFLKHDMEHYDRRGLADDIAKHNHYSTLEAREMFKLITGESEGSGGKLFGTPPQRRRWIKTHLWPRLPARWLGRFIYMYFLRLGILDGLTGFHFCLFMASYEHQISLKLREMMMERDRQAAAR